MTIREFLQKKQSDLFDSLEYAENRFVKQGIITQKELEYAQKLVNATEPEMRELGYVMFNQWIAKEHKMWVEEYFLRFRPIAEIPKLFKNENGL